MSIELANHSAVLGQVASNSGYSELIAAGKDNEALESFFERGYTDDIDGCVAGLHKLATDDKTGKDVATTASHLAGMMQGEKFAILTDGTSDDEE
jgi:hypothetical protein